MPINTINTIRKEQLERLFPYLIEGIGFHEWHEVFPSVIGFEPVLPQSFEIEEHINSFRSDDQVIAAEMIKYPEFHDRMVDITNRIMNINRDSKMWNLYDNETYPGISFAYALALQNINYLDLYAAFLLSVKPGLQIIYLSYDIVNLIKKWSWNPETYRLLFIYWFSNDKDKGIALNYLLNSGFNIDLGEKDTAESIIFIQTLELVLCKSGYAQDELQNKYQELFEELAEGFIYPNNKEKSDWLINRYNKVVEKLLHRVVVSELSEETNINATVDIFQQYKDEDFTEI